LQVGNDLPVFSGCGFYWHCYCWKRLITLNITAYQRKTNRQQGQLRKSLASWHSWNSNHPIGRIMLFELSRHSDHHYLASRKYQILKHHDNAPQLPTGYPGSMLLSLVPPLWFYVMNRKIKKMQAS
jgi:hypothetical protein